METKCPVCSSEFTPKRKGQVYCDPKCSARSSYQKAKAGAYGHCSVDGCDRSVRARGLCGMHYARTRKGQDLKAPAQRRPPRPCPVEGCTNMSIGRDDLCHTHYRRKRLYGTEHGTFKTTKVCVVDGCSDPATPSKRSSEYCRAHFVDWVKTEAVAGRVPTTTDGRGYRYISIYKKTYAVHRLVMEAKLGRPLAEGETPHHLNGRRDDNRPENLELWVKPQPSGQRPVDLVDWVCEHYPDLVAERMKQ